MAQAAPPNIGDTAPAPSASITLSQGDLDARMVQRAEQAKRNERQAVLESLGFKSLKEAEALVTAHREAQDAAKTEVQRAVDQANAEMAAAKAEREAIAKDRHDLTVERALSAAGARDNLSDLARLVNAEVGADAAAVEAAVESTKTKFASLFGAATASPAPSEPAGGGPPARPSSSPDAFARGAEKAKAYEAGQRSF